MFVLFCTRLNWWLGKTVASLDELAQTSNALCGSPDSFSLGGSTSSQVANSSQRVLSRRKRSAESVLKRSKRATAPTNFAKSLRDSINGAIAEDLGPQLASSKIISCLIKIYFCKVNKVNKHFILDPFCVRMYHMMKDGKSITGAVVWNFLKPLIRGRVLVYPDTFFTRQVMANVNKTFQVCRDVISLSVIQMDRCSMWFRCRISPILTNWQTFYIKPWPMSKTQLL